MQHAHGSWCEPLRDVVGNLWFGRTRCAQQFDGVGDCLRVPCAIFCGMIEQGGQIVTMRYRPKALLTRDRVGARRT
ncbi:hypothetical protein OKW49_006839 [Paraburkholderia youngii]|uniref:Uncharacterized protein n=1 Tax=Paraburkholderia youngii TaxID=2782701 RepID=A0A7W8LEE8_9BURK|nr:hypothetical protein [Paraburkholderia youngii]